MQAILQHLVEVHGLRRIAFIRGPEHNEEADNRFKAYLETLAAYNIPVDPQLIVPR